jgi:hypothetical protein
LLEDLLLFDPAVDLLPMTLLLPLPDFDAEMLLVDANDPLLDQPPGLGLTDVVLLDVVPAVVVLLDFVPAVVPRVVVSVAAAKRRFNA